MREYVEFDLADINAQFKLSKYNRDANLGNILDNNCRGFRGKYCLVIDEEATFINLFGLFVDSNTGNIALGMFPDPNRYILIGNIFDIIETYLYRGSDRKLPKSVDKKYLLEVIKICVSCCADEVLSIIEVIEEDDSFKYRSVILNMADTWEREKEKLSKKSSGHADIEDFLINVIRKCGLFLKEITRVSKCFFGAFIEENSSKDVILADIGKVTLSELLDSKAPNMESLTNKYLSMGISSDILFALKSYGMGIKDRGFLLEKVDNFRFTGTGKRKDLYRIAESLSSMSYMVNGNVSYHNDIVFNIIDLLRGLGWDNSFFFSLEMVKESLNRSLYDSLVGRFSIKEILDEYCISESDFVRGLTEYKKSVLSVVDYGSMYRRYTKPEGYCLSTYSMRQILNAGRVFDSAGSLVLKKFGNKTE